MASRCAVAAFSPSEARRSFASVRAHHRRRHRDPTPARSRSARARSRGCGWLRATALAPSARATRSRRERRSRRRDHPTSRSTLSSSRCCCDAIARRGSPIFRSIAWTFARSSAKPRPHRPDEPHARLLERLRPRAPIRNQHLRRLGRRRRPRVRREIDEREVHLVPDRAHDRDAARRHRAHERFVVEGEEIVARSAAAPHDDDVHFRHPLNRAERAQDRLRRPIPLHPRGGEEDARAAAAEGHLHHVVNHRPARARDDADDARILRERPLPLRREQPLGPELLFEPLERLEDRPAPDRFHLVGDELKPPARGVDRRLSADANARAVDEERAAASREARAVDDRVDGGVFFFVLEGEVDVSARGGAGVGDLAFDPDRELEGLVEGVADGAVELGDGEGAGAFGRGEGAWGRGAEGGEEKSKVRESRGTGLVE